MIILNGNEEDIDLMRTKMDARVASRKSSKKDKQKKEKTDIKTESVGQEASSSSTVKVEKSSKEPAAAGSSTSTAAPGPSSSKAPSDKLLKRGKMDKLGAPEFKKAKEDYSVAEDPKASAVFKSLFTSHESEQKQDRAHWVTYNPHYN